MTQEEKAKAYDEALEIAKKNYDTAQDLCNGSQIGVECFKNTLTNIFPELKESEDEKIRKRIIHALHGDVLDMEETNKAIAWLEKQHTQNQETSYPKFDFDDILALQCCMETAEKVTEDKELYKKLQSLHSRLHDAYWLEKQGEQKQDPCEHCDDKRLNCHNFPCVKKRAFEQGKSVLEVIKEEEVDNDNKVEQKPAWSEMDKTMVRLIKSDLELLKNKGDGEVGNAAYQGVINWLKSLKGRVQPQPKQKWSKDDKVMLNEIIDFLENGTVKLQHDLSLYASWLKSLKDRYAWRASWEQLDALQYVCRNFNPPLTDKLGCDTLKTLKLLYQDLKKL